MNMDQANAPAVEWMMEARPMLIGMGQAREVRSSSIRAIITPPSARWPG
jgi:hypothetical protein